MNPSESLHSSRPEHLPSALWWTRDVHAWIYFLRELTGVGIALYGISFLLFWFFNALGSSFFEAISWVGLISALFHSFTWFAVTLKVTPFDLPLWVERAGFLGLIVAWGAISYFLLNVVYVHGIR
jgi:hypothetical protein